MASRKDFAARGTVKSVQNGKVIFAPSNTNYKLHLQTAGPYTGPIDQLISVVIRASARKVYTVPSGGGFITPLFGMPKIIQGRALHVEMDQIVIGAGVPIWVQMPKSDDAVDLSEGSISVGSIVNAVTLAGATFEFVELAAPVTA